MDLITRYGRIVLLALCLAFGSVRAETPDPIAFSRAIEIGDIARVRGWLDAGLDPEYMGNQIGSGLMIAAWNGNIDLMALFVERGANPRRANRNGEQPLQLAVWNGHVDAAKWLLAHGAVLNREGNYWGALHYAVFTGNLELARYLIERGAEVNARSPNGSTPLMLAARENREELAEDLLAAGADPKLTNDWGDDALTMAMRYDHYRLGKLISSAPEFAAAVKASPQTFGEPSRSASAPSEIDELLRRIREAEATGQPSEALHQQLLTAVNAFKRGATQVTNSLNSTPVKSQNRSMPLPYQPKSIVITARRGQPGAERAQVVNSNPAAKPGSISITPVDQRARQAKIAELMRQIRLNEAEGRPATGLLQELSEAVEALKQ
ncbi:MAG: ankyrin repeat domain-containing protein [Propionivibrio sp.]